MLKPPLANPLHVSVLHNNVDRDARHHPPATVSFSKFQTATYLAVTVTLTGMLGTTPAMVRLAARPLKLVMLQPAPQRRAVSLFGSRSQSSRAVGSVEETYHPRQQRQHHTRTCIWASEAWMERYGRGVMGRIHTSGLWRRPVRQRRQHGDSWGD